MSSNNAITLTASRRSALALMIAVVLAVAAFVACGGGGDDEGDAAPVATAAGEEATPTAEAVDADSVAVDKAFWHAGWKVTLGEATLEQGDFGATLSIEAEFENLGTETATIDSQFLLVSNNNNYTEPTLDQELPQVPGELAGNGLITFAVDDEFDLGEAALIVGSPQNNQATVPIGRESDLLYVSLEPIELSVTGEVVAGPVTVRVEGAEVRADLPDIHSEVEEGKKAVIIRFSVTPGGGIPIGEGVFQSPNVALMLPDGTAVAVRDDGRSGVNELLQGREATTISGLYVRFEVPDPVEGTYTFIVRGAWGPDRAQVQGQLPFEASGASRATPGASPTAAAGN